MLLSSWTIEKEQDTKANFGWPGNGDFVNAGPVLSLVSARNRPNTGRFLRCRLTVLLLTKSPS